jgi:hypothetical protein
MRLEGGSPVTRAVQALGAATDGYTTCWAPASVLPSITF